MRLRAFGLFALLLTAAGCGGDPASRGTVLITLRYSDRVTQAERASVTDLTLEVSGAETFRSQRQVTMELASGSATLRYHPRATSGALTFDAAVSSQGGARVAGGRADASIDASRETETMLVLDVLGAPTDGGVDFAGADLSPSDLSGVDQSTLDLAMSDMAMPDLSMPDLRMPDLVMTDLSKPDLVMPDLVPPPDLIVPPDLTVPPDLVPPPDLIVPPDLGGPVSASHTKLPFINNAADLVAAVATIDTTNRRLLDTNNVNIPLPQNAKFTFEGNSGSAVLQIGGWTVGAGHPIQVQGNVPLIVLASGPVSISSRIAASAAGIQPGSGGYGGRNAPGDPAGPGAGTPPGINNMERPGGGGAGFRDPGAAGGSTVSQTGGAGGVSYGNSLASWIAGSGGGAGAAIPDKNNLSVNQAPPYSCNGGGTGSQGGAGGGAIQITSASTITVLAAGSIEAAGGGGEGGCLYFQQNQLRATGGGGGGSGGLILLEAPVVTIQGGLFANGGAGGGAGDLQNQKKGVGGQDGQASVNAATGGTSSGNGGAGGPGGTTNVPGGSPANRANVVAGGGGGGSAGRIYLHTRIAASITGTASPDLVNPTDL